MSYIIPLLASFLGAWLANLNFNKQKEREIFNLKRNFFEEIEDVKDDMIRIIPKLISSYDDTKFGVISDLKNLSLPREIILFITPLALEKCYSELTRDQRKCIKSIMALVGKLGDLYQIISSEFNNIDSLIKKMIRKGLRSCRVTMVRI